MPTVRTTLRAVKHDHPKAAMTLPRALGHVLANLHA